MFLIFINYNWSYELLSFIIQIRLMGRTTGPSSQACWTTHPTLSSSYARSSETILSSVWLVRIVFMIMNGNFMCTLIKNYSCKTLVMQCHHCRIDHGLIYKKLLLQNLSDTMSSLLHWSWISGFASLTIVFNYCMKATKIKLNPKRDVIYFSNNLLCNN